MHGCGQPVLHIEVAFCAEVSDAGKASQDQQEGDFDLYDIPGVDAHSQLHSACLKGFCVLVAPAPFRSATHSIVVGGVL